MDDDSTRPAPDNPEAGAHSSPSGEENGDDRSSPGKDLVAAVAIAALSVFAIVLALRLQTPAGVFTSPGLLPFFTGLTLLLMAMSLGAGAVRQGAARGMRQALRQGVEQAFTQADMRRVLGLIGLIVVYIILVDRFTFDLRLPLGFFVWRFSSYELISIIMLTLILRFFWRGAWPRCVLVSVVWIVALASVFRYGFHLLLPGSG